jgi:hypothetical protein
MMNSAAGYRGRPHEVSTVEARGAIALMGATSLDVNPSSRQSGSRISTTTAQSRTGLTV